MRYKRTKMIILGKPLLFHRMVKLEPVMEDGKGGVMPVPVHMLRKTDDPSGSPQSRKIAVRTWSQVKTFG